MLARFERSRNALSSFLTSVSSSRVLMGVKTIGPSISLYGANILVTYISFELEGGQFWLIHDERGKTLRVTRKSVQEPDDVITLRRIFGSATQAEIIVPIWADDAAMA